MTPGSTGIKIKKAEKVAEHATEPKSEAQANSSKAITQSHSTITQLKIHHRNEIKRIADEHATELNEVKHIADEHAKELNEIRRIVDELHNGEISRIALSHAKDLDAKKDRHGREIRRTALSYTKDLDATKERHGRAIRRIAFSHAMDLDATEQECQQELANHLIAHT